LFPHDKLPSCFFVAPPELRVEEQETVTTLPLIHPEVDLAYDLVQQFVQMLRTRTGEHLDAWLEQVERSKLPELQSTARGSEERQSRRESGSHLVDQ
jgi:transposase